MREARTCRKICSPGCAIAASQATHSIPVVFASVSYPVGMGLVRSLESPGTNLTGVANRSDVLSRKRLQLLKEVFPATARVAVIHHPHNAVEALMLAAMHEASAKLKLTLPLVHVKTEQDYAPAFRSLWSDRPDVLYVIENPLSFTNRARIVESVAGQRLPTVYGLAEFAEAGGLMSLSYSFIEHVRAAEEIPYHMVRDNVRIRAWLRCCSRSRSSPRASG